MSDRVNEEVASRLDEVGRLLASQRADPFRVRAYQRAAIAVRASKASVGDILAERGIGGLQSLPGVGESIARAIRDVLEHGHMAMLERLRGDSDPVKILATVPGIGRVLADRLHHDFGIDTLEDLEAAAYDGRLAHLVGFGSKRLAAIRDTLAHRLARIAKPSRAESPAPTIDELLDVDRDYRSRAAAGGLAVIAPRRFNPDHVAWLPILHTTRGRRRYTALFSNTARAHALDRTRDWVVIYWDEDGGGEGQCTVITAEHGPLRGKRIVRGREREQLPEAARAIA